MLKGLTWSAVFSKLIAGIFLGMIGILLGHFVGGLWADMSIADYLPWQAMLTWIGAVCGFLLGTQLDIEFK